MLEVYDINENFENFEITKLPLYHQMQLFTIQGPMVREESVAQKCSTEALWVMTGANYVIKIL